jgi:error-prone DNA polymerase
MGDMPYAELHCLSNFSFLRGASHPKELVLRAAGLGYHALAITDECSVAGIVKAWQAVKDHDVPLKLITGAEFHLADELLVILATNLKGYSQLCQLITTGRRRAEKGQYDLRAEDFYQRLDQCLCLWQPKNTVRHGDVVARLRHWQGYFPSRLWLLAENTLGPGAHVRLQQLGAAAEEAHCKVVCANNVHMHATGRKPLQDALTAIKHRKPLSEALPWLFPNAENHLRSRVKIQHLYTQEMISETIRIADRCQFSLSELAYRYPKDVLPPQFTAAEYLTQLAYEGASLRYPDTIPQQVDDNLKKELAVIAELQFEHYFLTIYDVVRFAKQRGILCQGRGSAANSTLCYCLHITEVNPIEVNLLFERFMSTARQEPPDIDVDFEHERREEVIQYIYSTYGRDRAALAATVITYRRKSAFRDIGFVLGIQANQLEQVIATYGWRYQGTDWLDNIMQPLGGISDQTLAVMKQLITDILGFPRHLSQHVGGFVITEGLLSDIVPIENASMVDRTVIQWDKDDIQSVRLMKMDVLALGMLSAVRKSLDMVRQFYQKPVTIQQIDRADAAVFDMIQAADTVGVFQIESRAQMNMLPRLRPACFYDLVVQVAIVRPGPIHGDMVHPYLRRRQGLEPIVYPNPEVQSILERTYGVPIFQEQVIRLAMVAGGFTAAEADQLRRSMARWKKTGQMSALREKLTTNMKARGYQDDYIARINRQIEGFGEYGFPESHAASFALIVYVSAWLKHYYPAAFCCALMNSQPMGFYSNRQLVQDAQRHQVAVLPVQVNHSGWDHALSGARDNPDIRLGLRIVTGLSYKGAKALLAARPSGGFTDLHQLEAIQDLHRGDLEALASANALVSIAGDRYQSRWATAAMHIQTPLLQSAYQYEPADLPGVSEMAAYVEDQSSLGLTLGQHPITLLRSEGQLPDTPRANQLLSFPHKMPITVLGIIVNRQSPKTASGVTFLSLEDDTGVINVVVWLSVAQRYLRALTTAKLVLIQGVLEKDANGQVAHVIAQHIEAISVRMDLSQVDSRDFH